MDLPAQDIRTDFVNLGGQESLCHRSTVKSFDFRQNKCKFLEFLASS